MSTPCCISVSLHHFQKKLSRAKRTVSSTPPSAFSSASTLSFLCWSSAKLRCLAFPFAVAVLVGPEGTVGACRLFILNGKPMLIKEHGPWRL